MLLQPSSLPLPLFLLALVVWTATAKLIRERSVECGSNSMDVALLFEEPFRGQVYAESAYAVGACSWSGHGRTDLVAEIPLGKPNPCGVREDADGTVSVKLVVSPVQGLLVEGFATVLVRCVYSTADITVTLPMGRDQSALQVLGSDAQEDGVVTGSGGAPLLSLQVLDGHSVSGAVLAKAMVGQRLTLDLVMRDTAIYDFYVHSCYAHDGSRSADASIAVIDADGCAVPLGRAIDAPVFVSQPVQAGPKHVYVHIYGFQFTSSQFVHFECQVRPCVHSCQREQCVPGSGQHEQQVSPASKKMETADEVRARRQRGTPIEDARIQPLTLQTVLQIESALASRAKKAAALSSAPDASTSECVQFATAGWLASLLLVATLLTFGFIYYVCLRGTASSSSSSSAAAAFTRPFRSPKLETLSSPSPSTSRHVYHPQQHQSHNHHHQTSNPAECCPSPSQPSSSTNGGVDYAFSSFVRV